LKNRVGVILFNFLFMKKIYLKSIFVVSALFIGSMVANAQVPISFSGQAGYAAPNGSFFKTESGEKMASFGIGADVDVLYHFEQLDYKLGVGLTLNSSFLFGVDLDGFGDAGLYALNLYGAKAQYRFLTSKVSPYGALSLGLSRFSAPAISIQGEFDEPVFVDETQHAFGFGIRPEVGVEFGWFVLSVGYMIPMSYTVFEETNSAGSLQFSLGARISLFERDSRNFRRPPARRPAPRRR
jgi:hypothetical protein